MLKKRYIGFYFFTLLCASFIVGSHLSSCGPASIADTDAEQLFVFQVYPLLENRCFSCHGNDPNELEGDFDMRSLANLLEGGESGEAAIVPGSSSKSPMYLAAKRVDEDFAMPPKENDKLNVEELQILKDWIDGGAPWPTEKRRAELIAEGGYEQKGKISIPAIGGLSDSWANKAYSPDDIWAFYPLQEVEVPNWAEGDEINPIDVFINDELSQRRLKAAPKADKKDLIKRLSYDLTGLPPSAEDIESFISDDSEDAFDKRVEQYLDSPHYGEHWAVHWLDVVRYGDSDGFSNDYARPNAWRYRDYVIRSFNEDKAYNEFVKEQLAGDEIDPNDPEKLIAAGFLRMGPWEHTGMSIKAETRQYFLDDVSNSVGEVFMGQPLRCARCHDHKYDPIPTKDVYAVQAVFATTQFTERPAPFLESENLSLMSKEQARVTRALANAKAERKRINDKKENQIKKWFNDRGRKYLDRKKRGKLPAHLKPPRNGNLTFDELGQLKQWEKFENLFTKEIAAYEPLAYSVYNGPSKLSHSRKMMPLPENIEGDPEETFILTGGSVYAKSDKVRPGALNALSALQVAESGDDIPKIDAEISQGMQGRRLSFANWLTQPDHPFTARVMVNRIWQYHFGKGIAENSNNLGATGKKPTHPELLDWLANYFVDNGWSVKAMHKLILSSDAWQRSSRHDDMATLRQTDPDNNYLAVFSPRRLDAEEIRDAMLQATTELNTEMGGIPIRPEINMEVALQPRHTMGSVAPAYQPSSTKAERDRRTIYALKLRNLTNPLLSVFNKPTSDLSCEKRSSSTVTPQVFMLFNDKFIRDRGVALANKIVESTDDNRIDKMFESIYGRSATEKELEDSQAYINDMISYHSENEVPKTEFPTEIERHMFEEMTGEPFRFVEKLEVYEDYEADLQMADVDKDTKALADLAVVLFNSNEFMYVY